MLSIIILLLFVILLWLLYKYNLRKNKQNITKIERKQQTLSVNQARLTVNELIKNGELLATPFSNEVKIPDTISLISKELFSRYETVRTKTGGFELSLLNIKNSEYIHGYTSIGHSEDWDIIQQSDTDEVFIVEGSETCEDEIEIRFPSIYHLIVNEISENTY